MLYLNYYYLTEAYFVSRNDILQWIHTVFQLNYDKIEQAGTGAFACQVLDYIYPNTIPMSRVSFNAKLDYEFVDNYKILQTAFKKCRIEKYIPVDKLVRCKYQDNLEFLQWLHNFWNMNANTALEYDPVARRDICKGGNYQGKTSQKTATATGTATAFGTSAFGNRNSMRSTSSNALHPSSTMSSPSIRNTTSGAPTSQPIRRPVHPTVPSTTTTLSSRDKSSMTSTSGKISTQNLQHEQQINELTSRIAEQETALSSLALEQSFYYEKLIAIERVCKDQILNLKTTNSEASKTLNTILKLLYVVQGDDIEQILNEGMEKTDGADLHVEYAPETDIIYNNNADFGIDTEFQQPIDISELNTIVGAMDFANES